MQYNQVIEGPCGLSGLKGCIYAVSRKEIEGAESVWEQWHKSRSTKVNIPPHRILDMT